jgi:hypothetical protein
MEVAESWNPERPAVRCIAWLDGWRGMLMGVGDRISLAIPISGVENSGGGRSKVKQPNSEEEMDPGGEEIKLP